MLLAVNECSELRNRPPVPLPTDWALPGIPLRDVMRPQHRDSALENKWLSPTLTSARDDFSTHSFQAELKNPCQAGCSPAWGRLELGAVLPPRSPSPMPPTCGPLTQSCPDVPPSQEEPCEVQGACMDRGAFLLEPVSMICSPPWAMQLDLLFGLRRHLS